MPRVLRPDLTLDSGSPPIVSRIKSQNDKAWSVKFILKGFGRGNSIKSFEKNYTIEKKNAAIMYVSKNAAIEYHNNSDGLRQNFLIHTKPAGKFLLKISLKSHNNYNIMRSISKNLVFKYSISI